MNTPSGWHASRPTSLLILCVIAFSAISHGLPIVAQEPSKIIDFQRDVLPILKMRCAECHEGEEAKNGMEVLDRDSMSSYIDSSGADASSLWVDYLIAVSKEVDPESLIMPPEKPLPPGELAILKLWLDEGATWPDELAAPHSDEVPELTSIADVPKGLTASAILSASGYFHPAVVHFPIALLILGAGAAFFSYLGGGETAKKFAFFCLIFGALTSVASAVAGWGFAPQRGYNYTGLMPLADMSDDQALLHRHRWFGIGTTILALLIAAIATVSMRQGRGGHVWRMGLVVCAMLVGITGHQGGEVVYGDILHKAMEKLGFDDKAPALPPATTPDIEPAKE